MYLEHNTSMLNYNNYEFPTNNYEVDKDLSGLAS